MFVTKSTRETLAKRMKDEKDELQLVIVRDMWLTGFDVPSMHTMYIDKPMLEQSIRKYQNRAIETTQIIMELIELAKKITEAEKRGKATGLTDDELAFYDALADNESAKEIMGDDILKQIAKDLTSAIKNSVTVDWTIRDSVQAKMKMVVKRLLKKYGYPPDKQEKAVEIVMEQTKLMCENEVN